MTDNIWGCRGNAARGGQLAVRPSQHCPARGARRHQHPHKPPKAVCVGADGGGLHGSSVSACNREMWQGMKIAVISDTHNLIRPDVAERIKSCDAVIHAGDFCCEKAFNELKDSIKPGVDLFAVRGNNDKWSTELPEHISFELWGKRFYVTHKRSDLPKDVEADIIVCGHSHRFFEEVSAGKLYLNPGSCGRRRFNLPITMAVLHIDNTKCRVEKIEFEDNNIVNIPMKNLPRTVKSIMERLDRGYSIDEICSKLRLKKDFVTEIARIKVTHSTADEYAIVDKIEVNNCRDIKSK